MKTIRDIIKKYHNKIDSLDLELIIASAIKKPREFVLAYPEARIALNQELRIKNYANRRLKGEPLAYILGRKEFYGLDFKVNKNTLIPRPETELLAELALQELTTNNLQLTTIIDIGTGSGNIIISLAKNLEDLRFKNDDLRFFGIDISEKALRVAKQNSKKHKVDKKIKFLKGNLLNPVIKKIKAKKPMKLKANKLIILANLPYLSKKIYGLSPASVKNYEPKSALLSAEEGLSHYKKLFAQIKKLLVVGCGSLVLMEISPEQKNKITKLVKTLFPDAKIRFFKDLAGKWRICEITL